MTRVQLLAAGFIAAVLTGLTVIYYIAFELEQS